MGVIHEPLGLGSCKHGQALVAGWRGLDGRLLADTTRDNYVEALERYVFPTFGEYPIGKLTADEIRR